MVPLRWRSHLGARDQLAYYSNFGSRVDLAAPGGARRYEIPLYDGGEGDLLYGCGSCDMKSGVAAMILSTEVNPVVSARGRKLGIRCVQGCADKLAALTQRIGDTVHMNGRAV